MLTDQDFIAWSQHPVPHSPRTFQDAYIYFRELAGCIKYRRIGIERQQWEAACTLEAS